MILNVKCRESISTKTRFCSVRQLFQQSRSSLSSPNISPVSSSPLAQKRPSVPFLNLQNNSEQNHINKMNSSFYGHFLVSLINIHQQILDFQKQIHISPWCMHCCDLLCSSMLSVGLGGWAGAFVTSSHLLLASTGLRKTLYDLEGALAASDVPGPNELLFNFL